MILVTGATGHVGSEVARLLLAAGSPVRALAREPAKIAITGVEPVYGDYANRASLAAAFAGIEAALIVSGYAPPGERARLHANAIEAARDAGVSFIVYTSFQGASPRSRFPMARDHHQTEGHLVASGVRFASLRDNFYIDLLPEMFDAQGVLRGPAGDGAVAWVGRDDVARTAAEILRHPAGQDGIHDVTGPESLTLRESAERLARLVKRPLRYVNESIEEARGWREATGAPGWEVDTWIGSYEAIAAGEVAATSTTIERVTGRAPQTLEAYFAARPELLVSLRGR